MRFPSDPLGWKVSQFSPAQIPDFTVLQVFSALPGCELSHQLCLLRQFGVDVIRFSCSFYLLWDKAWDTLPFSKVFS